MSEKYLLIRPDEDGDTLQFHDSLVEVLNNPRDYGIETFLDAIPSETNPNYWDEGAALLLRVEVVKVRVVATAFEEER